MRERSGPVRVGVVGLSATRGWALNAHLPALAAVGGFEVIALSASSLESARASARTLGVTYACANAEELVTHPEVDLVLVAVKVPEHRAIVSAAIRAGKAVLCEWPLGNGLEEAVELAALARAHGVPSFVGLQARSGPAVRWVHDLLAAGEIGGVLTSSVVGFGDRWGATIPPEVTYLLDDANGATMMTIPVAHTLDAVCHCLGELTEVAATTATRRPFSTRTDTGDPVAIRTPDAIAFTGRLQSGAVLAVHYTGGTSPGAGLRWTITGTEGTIELRGPTGHLQYGRVEVARAPAGAAALEPVAVPEAYERVVVESGGPHHVVANAYQQLADDLRTGGPGIPTFDDAVVRHRMVDAIERSARTGERCVIAHPEEREDPCQQS